MRRTLGLALAALVLVPASAGAGTTRPPLGLTATPARVSLAGSVVTAVRVTNPGATSVVVDVARAGFSLDLRGRPRVVPSGGRRAASRWLTVRPSRFVLPAGASRAVTVTSRLPARMEPGDHDALVLLTTRPRRSGGVAVRMRIGVVVVVRAPGRVVRRMALGGLRVRRAPGARVLELLVVNHGNVTETLGRGRVRIVVHGPSGAVRLRPEPRDLRPRTRGLVQAEYRGRLRGWVIARAQILPRPGARVMTRTFRVKL